VFEQPAQRFAACSRATASLTYVETELDNSALWASSRIRSAICNLNPLKFFRSDLADDFVQWPLQQFVDRRIEKRLSFLLEGFAAQVFLNALWQGLVYQFVNFAMNAFT